MITSTARCTLSSKSHVRPIAISQAGRKLLISAAPAWRSAQVKAKQLLGEEGVAAIVSVADSIPLDELVE
ncbi:hypothetical protein KSZ_55840 [Dictyobacter formicarum]|uniref:Uncharacterized protein n=1 Tax=Dictyobacter formicarum TaxID=2778368 RepID=A0ABQ3VPQ2_9CHLR|nr:hypothetical protein KSZ_55840 [Dictyobacter formicarum]